MTARRRGEGAAIKESLRYGVSRGAQKLNEAAPVLPAGRQKWIPQPGGELLQTDERRRLTGWCYAPVSRLAPVAD